ncbi:MAG TPA: PGF-pre-PGF domain-containing protein [Methanosarcina sp.]|nr:PGF-pre-PGF domain-containing protein [Methanosarcina sp.]
MIEQDSITLNRYNNKSWEQTQATLSGEDSRYLYFTSEVSGYSFFAITGETKENQPPDVIIPKNDTQENEQNNLASEIEQPSDQKGGIQIPGFEVIYFIIGLLGVFLYRKRQN